MAPARCPKKLRPEVGPPTKSSACHPHLWEPRPAANGASPVPEKASARGRTSHKAVHAALICGSREPRRMAPARCPKKLRPEVGPPTKSSARRSHCGSRALAANGASSVPEKIRPEVGPPTKSSARRSRCGSRDPRRMAPARCPKKLRPEVGPPTKNSGARRSHCGSRALAANGASPVPEKASARGRTSH